MKRGCLNATASFAFLGLRCGIPPRQTHEINADGRSQIAAVLRTAKNCTASGPVHRGRPLTSQTAFGGQLPYKGSLVRPVARCDHNLSEYNVRLLRATNHEQRATIFSRAEGHSRRCRHSEFITAQRHLSPRRPANCQLRQAGPSGPNIKRKAGLTIDLISLKFLAFSVKFVD